MPPDAPVSRMVSIVARSPVPQPGGERLVALAAVEQMALHCGARRRNCMRADRPHDRLVLLLDALQIGLPFLGGTERPPHGLARDDEAAEIFEKADELRIAGRLGDAAVERKILVDR